MAVCLVISGAPCAGKSTLAAALASRAGWPLLAKDDYKERVFDRLGAGDREWSRRISLLAWDLLLAEAARLLGAGADCVLEGNFRAPQIHALATLQSAVPPHFIEIRCGARHDVLVGRYRARAAAGTRHPGHVDLEALAQIAHEFGTPAQDASRLGGPVLEWDTTHGFETGPLLAALAACLAT